jgi:hypothetical protein
MRLPTLFGRDRSVQGKRDAQDHAEKVLADTFRVLGQLCGKLADLIEAQRLTRSGYEKQEEFLERIDAGGKPGPGTR